jgi:CrcB protein
VIRTLGLAFVGGCAGGALRIAIGQLWHAGDGVPWELLVINLVGSFAIGIVGVMWGGHRGWWPLLGPGLLGGFTTFSAIAAMTWTTSAGALAALAVLAVSLVVCTCAARLGVHVGELVRESQ